VKKVKLHQSAKFLATGSTIAEISTFQIFEIFNGHTAQEGRTECAAMPNLVEISQNAAEIWRYFDFSRWRPSAILALLCVCSDHPRRVFGGLYRCAKFGWNRCSSFDNMHVFQFCEFGLKMPIHAPKIWVLGEFYPLNGEQCQRNPKKAHPCTSPRRLSHHVRKSVDESVGEFPKKGYK